jgi:hypothetical protein
MLPLPRAPARAQQFQPPAGLALPLRRALRGARSRLSARQAAQPHARNQNERKVLGDQIAIRQ